MKKSVGFRKNSGRGGLWLMLKMVLMGAFLVTLALYVSWQYAQYTEQKKAEAQQKSAQEKTADNNTSSTAPIVATPPPLPTATPTPTPRVIPKL